MGYLGDLMALEEAVAWGGLGQLEPGTSSDYGSEPTPLPVGPPMRQPARLLPARPQLPSAPRPVYQARYQLPMRPAMPKAPAPRYFLKPVMAGSLVADPFAAPGARYVQSYTPTRVDVVEASVPPGGKPEGYDETWTEVTAQQVQEIKQRQAQEAAQEAAEEAARARELKGGRPPVITYVQDIGGQKPVTSSEKVHDLLSEAYDGGYGSLIEWPQPADIKAGYTDADYGDLLVAMIAAKKIHGLPVVLQKQYRKLLGLGVRYFDLLLPTSYTGEKKPTIREIQEIALNMRNLEHSYRSLQKPKPTPAQESAREHAEMIRESDEMHARMRATAREFAYGQRPKTKSKPKSKAKAAPVTEARSWEQSIGSAVNKVADLFSFK